MSTPPPRRLSILVVDDHADWTLVIEQLLRRQGHDVSVASGFAEALSVAAAMTRIDVLVSDITLPDGNGRDLLPLLRERAGGGVTNAIALTGHSEEQWVRRCREAGFDTVLVKPVNFADLLAAVGPAAHVLPRQAFPIPAPS